jgi:hypothetical protein
MNMSEAMKFKREIKAISSLDAKMLDTAEDGYVLVLERKSVSEASYALLVDFAGQNHLNLQLDIGNYIVSTNMLAPARQSRQVF